MTSHKVFLTSIFAFGSLFSSGQCGEYEVSVTTAKGEQFLLPFHSEDSLQSVYETLHQCIGSESPDQILRMEFSGADDVLQVKAYECTKGVPRNYYAPITSEEKKDISFILKTLANSSLAKIGKNKSALKKAGDRIDHLHPFKFLETVFTDEELKVCIRNIEGKSWVWSEFRDGIVSSLGKESDAGNLKPEYIQNMASLIKIDVNAITPTIDNKDWSKLLTDLIAIVPRSGDSDRYNQ